MNHLQIIFVGANLLIGCITAGEIPQRSTPNIIQTSPQNEQDGRKDSPTPVATNISVADDETGQIKSEGEDEILDEVKIEEGNVEGNLSNKSEAYLVNEPQNDDIANQEADTSDSLIVLKEETENTDTEISVGIDTSNPQEGASENSEGDDIKASINQKNIWPIIYVPLYTYKGKYKNPQRWQH